MAQQVCQHRWKCPSTSCCCMRDKKPASAPERWNESTKGMKMPCLLPTVLHLHSDAPLGYRSITLVFFCFTTNGFFVFFFQFQMSQLNIIDSEVFLLFYSWGRRSSWRPRKVSHWRCFRLLPACVSTKASWQQRQHRVTTDQVIDVTQMCAFYFPTEEKLGFSALLL